MTGEREITRVRAEGTRERTPWFDASIVETGSGRAAVIVPRFHHSAVARNRVKRRLRELVRRELAAALGGRDIVVRAAPSAYRASFDELRRAVHTVARRFGPTA